MSTGAFTPDDDDAVPERTPDHGGGGSDPDGRRPRGFKGPDPKELAALQELLLAELSTLDPATYKPTRVDIDRLLQIPVVYGMAVTLRDMTGEAERTAYAQKIRTEVTTRRAEAMDRTGTFSDDLRLEMEVRRQCRWWIDKKSQELVANGAKPKLKANASDVELEAAVAEVFQTRHPIRSSWLYQFAMIVSFPVWFLPWAIAKIFAPGTVPRPIWAVLGLVVTFAVFLPWLGRGCIEQNRMFNPDGSPKTGVRILDENNPANPMYKPGPIDQQVAPAFPPRNGGVPSPGAAASSDQGGESVSPGRAYGSTNPHKR